MVEDAAGNRIVVVGTSEPDGYLRPGVRERLLPGEVVVGGTGHAEQNIVAFAQQHGYSVVSVGAGRPVCSTCADTILGSGGAYEAHAALSDDEFLATLASALDA